MTQKIILMLVLKRIELSFLRNQKLHYFNFFRYHSSNLCTRRHDNFVVSLDFLLIASSSPPTAPSKEPLGQEEVVGLRACLERRNLLTSVVPVRRGDWLRVFVGILLDEDARAGNGTAEGAYGWYLDLTKKAVEESFKSTGRAAVLIGHSAGGWLGRAVLQREGLESWLILTPW